ncbi:MAG TPA: LacI family DNA-binding transcriptional regulator [Paracoccaceae bacterium]|nr:LacI family DNA-binding transcriptional regulator [Paracoccaceae bacterium]
MSGTAGERPTIKTICAMTGLSTATVSKALRKSPEVRPETRAIVEAAAEKVGYSTNLHGVQLRTGKTYQVAILMTTPTSDETEWEGVEYAQLLAGISHAMEDTRYRVALYPVRNQDEAEETIRQIIRNRQADGVIFSGTRPEDIRVRLLQEADFPFVTYGTTSSSQPHAFVDADNDGIVRTAMARLIARGHRRIALINPPAHLSYGQTRLETYRQMLEEAGLPFDPSLVAHDRLTPSFGKAQVTIMHALKAPPSAYICANEASALGALSGFAACGLVHGRDAVINATDDLNVSAYFTPPLTTFYLPISRPAELLGRHILRAMAGEAPEKLQSLLMPDLIERNDDRLRP